MPVGTGYGHTPGFGGYNPFSMPGRDIPQQTATNPAWITIPGVGMVRNPNWNPPSVNGWQQSTIPGVQGMVRPGVNQANQANQAQQPQTPSTPAPQTPTVTAPPPAPRVTELTTDYGAGIRGNNISTGIQAGPIYNQQQTQQALQPFRNEASRPLTAQGAFGNIPMTPQAQNDLGNRFQEGMQYRAQNAMTDAGRDISFGNAQHLLASQKARAQGGTGWGNLAARLEEISTNEDIAQRNTALSLLAALGLIAP